MRPQIINAIRACERRDGATGQAVLLAEDVVTAAEATDSPLHRFFEWDNNKAAGQYRTDQARALIQRVQVYLPTQNEGRVKVHLYHHLVTRDAAGYRRLDELTRVEPLRDALLRQLRNEVSSMREKLERHAAVLENDELTTALEALDRALVSAAA